jgi:hypothetical protein
LEFQSVLGHKAPTMETFYYEQARQERMSESAVAKWDVSIQKNAARKVAGKRRGSWSSLDPQHDMQLQGR